MAHEPRLSAALRQLIHTQRVGALGTLDASGVPFVSMVPFAVEPDAAQLIIHVSSLAAHTRNLQGEPRVSLLVMQSEAAGEPVHALPRVTLDGVAGVLVRDSVSWQRARSVYLTRFPDAEPMTELGDFMFVGIAVQGARQVAGFGTARSLDANAVAAVLRPAC